MSSQLLWSVLRKNSCFLVKTRNAQGAEFSLEKGNLTNKNSFKYSGLSNEKAVDIAEVEGGVELSVKSRKEGALTKPKKTWNKTGLKRNTKRTVRVLKNALEGYRSDLKADAVKRAVAISNAQKRKSTSVSA
uniref:Ribosomal eL28/Mak16 domain-containing protein n=1 Tax=Rhodosorus marinus TaxID=101924 RepID=A0A7S2ZLC2_9RHOD|mmetsp:Transcript_22150/g.89697  ORF Transcript_22150/g.89697 Transcript_22150/m.89697 type:complete len:132 (+) Transcript_22150:227-622(+)|eukprot:CAMPEP_0113966842 /NCGR_PEP_ID=MMETSP0011_2-20120614/8540_1 /TAXON_ID=101924 /ORGANISM="Rhodosorus marinus" /LENGTH=131 /DNA_ID=CAMNT_0000979541 /DNA_START=221 /DNA_END=616 /DNA_ORIENTATION=+ /assembly_acc=CAM_ASM_000156